MSYSDYEGSRALGQPIALYLFRYGTEDAAYHAYTDAETSVVYDGITYLPVPIDHDAVVSSGKLDEKEFTLRVTPANEIAQMFSFYPTSSVISLTIRHGHVPNPDAPAEFGTGEQFPAAWVGRVVERSTAGQIVTLACVPASASMKRPGLTRHWQYSCPLALYGTRCGADKEAAKRTRSVNTASGNRVTFLTGWNDPEKLPTDYIGGLVEWDTSIGREYRMILGVNGNELRLTGPTAGLVNGSQVDVFLGCPRTLDDCTRIHENTVNYGGHPWIPKGSPVNKNVFE